MVESVKKNHLQQIQQDAALRNPAVALSLNIEKKTYKMFTVPSWWLNQPL